MISNHFAMTYGHDYGWVILVAIAIAGALIRVYFVARHKGRASPLPVSEASFDEVRGIVIARCTNCHAAEPSHPGFPAAPGGVMLDSDARILAEAERIHLQTVVTRVMPIGNLTGITEEERAVLDAWYRGLDADD